MKEYMWKYYINIIIELNYYYILIPSATNFKFANIFFIELLAK